MKFFLPVHQDIGPIGPDRNWKGIGISLLVIMAVLSCIGLSIVLLSQDGSGKTLGAPLALDDLFQRSFEIHDPEAKWISAQEVIYRSWNGDIFKLNVYSNETELLLKNSTFVSEPLPSCWALQPLWVLHAVRSLSREVWELNPPEVPDSVLQFASWGVQGQQLLYVFENNIYYQADSRSFSWRLTSSGQEAAIFNGIADWLYEEEVLDSPVAHWWSPDGSRLAYLTINDSLVPSMMLPRFTGSLYPRGTEYPYPKMGQINPSVSLHVVSLDGSSTSTQISLLLFACLCSDFYVTMVKWVTRQNLSVRWVNRAQNMSILSLCDASSGACVTVGSLTLISHPGRTNMELHLSMLNGFHKECLSCSLFKPDCSFYQAAIAPDHRHVLLSCTGKTWQPENLLLPHSKPAGLFTVRFSGFPGLFLFKCFYSLLTDSAPGGRVVSERFSLGWESVLVSSDRVVVARVDGRGSAGRGQDVLQAVYQNLGVVDVQDQIAALQRLMKLPYIDRSRVGVYGKAYGGFLSSVLLLTFSSMIKCGVAVAPVTNWKLCGSAGSERFFGFPLSSLIRDSSGPGPRDFLIVHGTADASTAGAHGPERPLVAKLMTHFKYISYLGYKNEMGGYYFDSFHFHSATHIYAYLFSFISYFFIIIICFI
uniref:Uncharacterized protein n=1 Tax=Poecilia latipinna TaxID=48699 RepID=A0A3B3U5F5_9TELE